MLPSAGQPGGLTGRATVLLALLLTATATFAANGVDDFRILYAEAFPAAASSIRASEARAFMVTPPDAAPGSHVIYRLSDTLVDLGPGYCGAVDDVSRNPAATGLSTFKSMTGELKSQLVLSQAAGATRSLNLFALGDASFLARYASASAAHDAVLVDAGTSRAVGLTLKALASGTFAVTAVGTATNDGK